MKSLIDKLEKKHRLSRSEWVSLISNHDKHTAKYLFERSREVRHSIYGKDIFIRGLIEISNYCKNDCYYCGIRKGNVNVERYRLTKSVILDCCKKGYEIGFRTFVLQGGEDLWYNDFRMTDIIYDIKSKYPDCALTLSLGEKSRETYQKYFDAGADRYLLRHETADPKHYIKLHPAWLSLNNRKRCLSDLKEIGYQVGSGFMVGSPYQTPECLAEDMIFLSELEPHMVGIGPFIAHHDTPFKSFPNGSLEMTLFMIALVRLTLPRSLIPATTALGTIDKFGREKGILAGANVVMPNLSPCEVRKKYLLYDNKLCTGNEAAECKNSLEIQMEKIGYKIAVSRGDFINI